MDFSRCVQGQKHYLHFQLVHNQLRLVEPSFDRNKSTFPSQPDCHFRVNIPVIKSQMESKHLLGGARLCFQRCTSFIFAHVAHNLG